MENSSFSNTLLTYANISDRWNDILKEWYNKSSLESVFEIYFSLYYNSYLYLHNIFLSVLQAIEGYHRCKMRNKVDSEEVHKKRIKNIKDSIPVEYKEWLNEKLQYSNEPSLRIRLRDIIDDLSEKYSFFQQVINDNKSFVNNVVNLRNDLIHLSKKDNSEKLEGKEIYKTIELLKVIFDVKILEEIGFSIEEINRIIDQDNCKKFKHLLR